MTVSKEFNIGSNHPLILDDPECAYVIQKGSIDIFICHLLPDGSPGRRAHLFRMGENEALWGISTLRERNKVLVAVGTLDSKVVTLDRDAIGKLIKTDPPAQWIRLFDSWMEKVLEYIGRKYLEKGIELLPPGMDQYKTLKKQMVSIRKGLLWMQVKKGSADFLGVKEIHADSEYTPISPEVWVTVQEDSELAFFPTGDFTRTSDLFPLFDAFNAFALDRIFIIEEEKSRENLIKYRQQKQNDKKNFSILLADIANSLDPKNISAAEYGKDDDLLLKACRMVGDHIKTEIKKPGKGNDLQAILRESRIRSRKLILKGDWWKQDSGAFIAFLEDEDKAPVAVIPSGNGKYYIFNPANGEKKQVNRASAETLSAQAYMFYKPFPDKALSLKDLFLFGLQGLRNDIVMIIVMGIISGLFGIGIPVVSGIIFDDIIPGAERLQLLQVGFLLIVVVVAQHMFSIVQGISGVRLTERMGTNLQAAVWDRLLSLPVPFFRKFTAGDLADRAMGINNIQQLITGSTMTTLLAALFSIFNFFLLFYYDPGLALGASVLIIIAAGTTVAFGIVKLKYQRVLTDLQGKISGTVLQFMTGIPKFRIAGIENRAYVIWARDFLKQREYIKKTQDIENISLVFNEMFNIFSTMVIFLMLILSSRLGLSTGKFIAFNSAFTMLLSTAIRLSGEIMSVLNIIPLYERSKPVLETVGEVDESKTDPGTLTGRIELKHVQFRYTNDGPLILDNVSLDIEPGEFVAFVGPSGSGKSTLLRILLGFESCDSGAVLYDSQDLSELDIRKVRQQIGVVLQNSRLQDQSILENIIGSHPLTKDDAWEAARMAGLFDDIKAMPMGMHTYIMSGGATLSGGQKQRLLIARSIANKPRVLFFDEATSALDNKTQAIVSKSLEDLQSTRIVIAHRLSTIINADRIYVIQDGIIREQGNYSQLMKKNGIFADLAKRQLA